MASPVIQFKRGAFASLPALKAGEPAFTNDKYDLYIGLDNDAGNNKFFGSHRYWLKETTTAGSESRLFNALSGQTNTVSITKCYEVIIFNQELSTNELKEIDWYIINKYNYEKGRAFGHPIEGV